LRRLGDAQAAPGQRAVSVPEPVWRRIVGIDGGCAFELAARLPMDDLVIAPANRTAFARAAEWARKQTHCVLVLRGRPGTGRTALAAALADTLKRRALLVTNTRAELGEVAREARWFGSIPVLSNAGESERTRQSVDLARLAEATGVVIVIAEAGIIDGDLPLLDLEVAALTRAERSRLWTRALGLRADDTPSVVLDGVVDRRLGPGRIFAAARRARERAGISSAPSREDLLSACRLVGGEDIGGAADRIEPRFTLDDLVLPQATRRELELAITWGRQLEALSARGGPHLSSGRGLACLFSGPPGTGKTSAAQVLARELGLELYRVDLSRVVDKYIGETEKHLARLFDQAELHNFVLLFDEADALFGRRTDVHDAHDRFANVETSYLLQRLEQHQGIAILATNLRNNLDPAFLRRLHVIADFPLPSAVERRLLWQRLIPKPHEDDVDFELLASRFALSGGDIRNAVLAALVLAGDAPVAMRHLVVGVWREQSRSGRLLDGNEFGSWQSELASWLGRRP
jgi:AAA+ superfamily predicted ATPase